MVTLYCNTLPSCQQTDSYSDPLMEVRLAQWHQVYGHQTDLTNTDVRATPKQYEKTPRAPLI